MLEQNVAVYRASNETRFFVVGSALVRVSFHTRYLSRVETITNGVCRNENAAVLRELRLRLN